jgi:hypothetical protein
LNNKICLKKIKTGERYGLAVKKTLKYDFCISTQKSSNENTVFVGYSIGSDWTILEYDYETRT